jgi:hypothetical protein
VPQGFAKIFLQYFEFHNKSIAWFIANRYWQYKSNISKETAS